MREYQSHRFLVEFEQLLNFLLERKQNVGDFNTDTLVESCEHLKYKILLTFFVALQSSYQPESLLQVGQALIT